MEGFREGKKSGGQSPAVDIDGMTGNEPGGVRGQEEDRTHDLLGLGQPSRLHVPSYV
jgi:hypothetical protein